MSTNIEKNSELQRYIELATDEYFSRLKAVIGEDMGKLDITINGAKLSQVGEIVEGNTTDENIKVSTESLIDEYYSFCKISAPKFRITISTWGLSKIEKQSS